MLDEQKENQVRLFDLFQDDFMFGAAVNTRTIVSAHNLLKEHFNSITAENEMKFANVHPQEFTYTFEEADKIAMFARMNGLKLRGHTLVWHNQTPNWVFENEAGGKVDRQTLLDRMRTHIHTVVQRYGRTVYAWDVVNEAVTDEGDEWLRPSNWLEGIGEDYLVKAFQYAHEADPHALLFYNDYNESDPGKREKIYRLVKWLQERGAPIHGIGLQAHWNLHSPSLDEIRASIERYASLGVQLQITEMDVSVFDHDDHRTDLTEPTADLIRLQAERYGQFFDLFREYRDVITGVTFWGAADDYTWLDYFPVRDRKNWPLLFDGNHRPKPAFHSVIRSAGRNETS